MQANNDYKLLWNTSNNSNQTNNEGGMKRPRGINQ